MNGARGDALGFVFIGTRLVRVCISPISSIGFRQPSVLRLLAPAEIKFPAAGFDFLTAFGDKTYAGVFDALAEYRRTPLPPDPTPPDPLRTPP